MLITASISWVLNNSLMVSHGWSQLNLESNCVCGSGIIRMCHQESWDTERLCGSWTVGRVSSEWDNVMTHADMTTASSRGLGSGAQTRGGCEHDEKGAAARVRAAIPCLGHSVRVSNNEQEWKTPPPPHPTPPCSYFLYLPVLPPTRSTSEAQVLLVSVLSRSLPTWSFP